MASIGHERHVLFVRLAAVEEVALPRHPIDTLSVVPRTTRRHQGTCWLNHLPHIPELDRLVLRIADEVAAVPFAVHVRDAREMSHKHSCGLGLVAVKAAPVPNLDESVVRARAEEGRALVKELDRVHVVVMRSKLEEVSTNQVLCE